MSDEIDYLDRLQRMGLTLRHSPQCHESRIHRLLNVAHTRAWFVACIPDHAPDEWQLFIDAWRMLPPDVGLPFLMLKSWLKRWHADVPWMERWMVNAAWAIRRGDDRGGVLSRRASKRRAPGRWKDVGPGYLSVTRISTRRLR